MLNKGTGASVFSCSWSRLKYKEGIQAFVSLGIDRNDITTDKYDAIYLKIINSYLVFVSSEDYMLN